MLIGRYLLALCGIFTCTQSFADPIRVFILAGQSNMEGKGAIRHLEQLLADPATAESYKHLKDGDEWVQRDDVYIKFNDDRGKGKLSVGYATPPNRFGPELEFGHVVGNALKERVLIIKCAWGGRALAVRFRPPSSGLGDYTTRDRETKELKPLPPETYGEAYRDTIRIVKETLADIKSVVPDDDGSGYELSGFVFFQGFNDIIDAKKTGEYGVNLANLIRDLRRDLDAPNMPFIIGELGQQGTEPEKRHAEKHFHFRKLQKDVADMDEFNETVRFVETSPFVITDGDKFDGGYHYMGRADTFFNIGRAFGQAILPLLDESPRLRKSKQWVSLFNGTNLDGWVIKCRSTDSDKRGYWKVVDGTITGQTPPGSKHHYIWLLTEQEFADFELKAKVQTIHSSQGNSGIQVRSRYDEQAGWLDGPQVDINPPGPWRNGFIYDETRGAQIWLWPDVGRPANAKPKHAPEGWSWQHANGEDAWNDVHIICQGPRIRTIVNGVTVADYDGSGRLNDEYHQKRNVGMKGRVGLQIHPGGPLLIRFKDVAVRELR